MVGAVRVAVITESFLPQVNGVTSSVQRVCEHLAIRGHHALVVAPGPGPASFAGFPVVRAPSIPTPGYRDFRLGTLWPHLTSVLRSYQPDVVHLASPVTLGAQGAWAAHRLDVPSVSVFQTDLAGFARSRGFPGVERTIWRWLRQVHALTNRTLAPSAATLDELRRRGVQRVARWARGVDVHRFHPRHRSDAVRRTLSPAGDLLVGYVGRLAAEKDLTLLATLDGIPGIQLVVVGDGPQRAALERLLRFAVFTGFQTGEQLAAVYASLDVFVHTGPHETFCQSAQEAQASGVPVVAPAAGGLLDLIDAGRTGLLFPAGNRRALREAVLTLAHDEELRSVLGVSAQAAVQGRSWDVLGDQLLGHYRAVGA